METKGIKLGEKYRTKLFGFEGVAFAHAKYYTGCDRICLQYLKDGEIKEYWVDINDIDGIELSETDKKPGGPASVPTSRNPR